MLLKVRNPKSPFFQINLWLKKLLTIDSLRVNIVVKTECVAHLKFFFNLMVHDQIVSRNFFPSFSLCSCIYFFRHEEQPRPFVLHSCLRNSNDEVRFLQTCSRVLVLCLLPSKNVQSLSLRIMLAEILTTKGRLS